MQSVAAEIDKSHGLVQPLSVGEATESSEAKDSLSQQEQTFQGGKKRKRLTGKPRD